MSAARPEPAPRSISPYVPEVLVRRTPSSSGDLDGDLVGLALARHREQLATCYHSSGGSEAGRGVVYLFLDVEDDGRVSGMTIGHSDLRSRRFEDCLRRELSSISMPRSVGGSTVQAHLVFGASDEAEGRAMLSAYRAGRRSADSATETPVSIAGLRGRIQSCYERVLRARPGLRGRTVLRLTLAADGSVTRAAMSDDEMGQSLRRCVIGAVQDLRLLRDDPSIVTLHYPLFLEPGSLR